MQLRPWVFRCELTAEDWNIPEGECGVIAHKLAAELNQQIVNVINGGTDRKAAEQKMAQTVAEYELSIEVKNSILSVVDRLMRATFE